jgi:signal transduction histidine kinase
VTTGPWLPRGTLRRDLVAAGACFLLGLVLHSLGTYRAFDPDPGTPAVLHLLTLSGACVAVVLRRIATRTGLVLGTVAFGADVLLGGSVATILVYANLLYESCVYGPPYLRRWLLRIAVALTVVSGVAGIAVTRSWQGVGVAVDVLIIGVLPVLTGISVRQYRDQAAAERARAEQTARLAELDRQQAIAAERNRMARELHDVIANHLSAIAIHASAALSVPGLDRAQLDQALRVIRANSVQGLAEMRQMIALLREPASVERPEADGRTATDDTAGDGALRARLAEVDRLVDRVSDLGLSVRLETTGEPRPLPASVDLAAYRIVQESLTNALKHGAGQAQVRVDYLPKQVRITVENPLPENGVASPLEGAGAGLIGMRERATLLRGRFDAGPRGRCWQVYAELPTLEVTG